MSDRRQYYPALDLIRGVAAFFVLIYHVQHWLLGPGYAVNAGLAVDLFFCLSGFVLASAYRDRFAAGMPLSRFVVGRLIRLMPLVVVATLVSGAYVWARTLQGREPISGIEVAVAMALNLLSIPYPGASPALGGPQLFPLNGPQYTIFLELFANIAWWFTSRIGRRGLDVAIVVLSLIGLLWLGLGGDTADTFWSGLPRVLYSFYAGAILFAIYERAGEGEPTAFGKVAFWICFVLMVGVFALPLPYLLPSPVELAFVALLSPALVLTAARIRIEGRLFRVSVWLGAVSYPIYILHYPVFCWINGAYQTVFKTTNFMVEAVGLLVILPVVSALALRVFDEPVRSRLMGWLRRSRSASGASTGLNV
ncbi:acyltransferase family protein [Methylobacterium persicinum]|uniref:Peptidoglycan/LPS O-acetylase OafA/YrhL n=1 Tax=Methylobacterium persicinum TaxID=374426 RepID=A0ABU0HQB6_9HYPH|nr:acyltransferase [Methylobacterium persicinum]MDQ0444501.1 peptidoglycan/LPS O-acetylase OafA/YrhL [Methylobacterium persicinum]